MIRALFLAAMMLGAAAAKEANKPMNGAISPTGDPHPGEIIHDDQVAGRVWTERAENVPLSIAWVKSNEKWIPVLKIRITGTTERREMTFFGPDGKFLQTTVQAPPPRRSK